jgi:vacuolar-type H+-ATPase subunit C/Vma6
MMPGGRYAFANARARAMKSRLLAGRVSGNLAALAGESFRKLIDGYAMLMASYPIGQSLFLALVRLHEIDNLKLAWRAAVRGLPPARWLPFWVPLGSLAVVDSDDCRDCRTLSALTGVLTRTPYFSIAETMRRAHADDLAAAEVPWSTPRCYCPPESIWPAISRSPSSASVISTWCVGERTAARCHPTR